MTTSPVVAGLVPRTSAPRALLSATPPWWSSVAVLAAGAALVSVPLATVLLLGTTAVAPAPPTAVLGAVLHLPWALIIVFLVAGLVERIGCVVATRREAAAATAGSELRVDAAPTPRVTVQLPFYNEPAVARRAILAAAALEWPRDRLAIQVLDDSTDPAARAIVDAACAEARAQGATIELRRRATRSGYKAGALEEGRRATDAEFIAILDADFVPPHDFLLRAVAGFGDADGVDDEGLAVVQARWGHLNADESWLTSAQSLWVDDHHVLQMTWRSRAWGFVNFTGTAGVWRASAIEAIGGWRAASLVEDCELSVRALLHGYRTRFLPELVAPAELPASLPAYRAQQRRWTRGWVQLQRLHFGALLRLPGSPLRRLHVLYHVLIPWQWALWGAWMLILPPLVAMGAWAGAVGPGVGLAVYLAPPLTWLLVSTVLSAVETGRRDDATVTARGVVRRVLRAGPQAVLTTGMLPHQLMAVLEGLIGDLHAEFERTPKAGDALVGAGSAADADRGPRPARPAPPARPEPRDAVGARYAAADRFAVAYQALWSLVFLVEGQWWSGAAAAAVALCVVVVSGMPQRARERWDSRPGVRRRRAVRRLIAERRAGSLLAPLAPPRAMVQPATASGSGA